MKDFVRKGSAIFLTVLMAVSVFTGCSKDNGQEIILTDESALESTTSDDVADEKVLRSLKYWSLNFEQVVGGMYTDKNFRKGLTMDFYVLDMNNDSTTELLIISHTNDADNMYLSFLTTNTKGEYARECMTLIKENVVDFDIEYAFYDGNRINYILKYISTKEIDDTTRFVEEGYIRFYMYYYKNPWGGADPDNGIYSSMDPVPVFSAVKHVVYYEYLEDGDYKTRNIRYYIGEGQLVDEEEYYVTNSLANYVCDVSHNSENTIFDVTYNPVKGVDCSTTMDYQWLYNQLLDCYSSYRLDVITDTSMLESADQTVQK